MPPKLQRNAASTDRRERVRVGDAVLITGLSRRTLQEKAAAGVIPGARKTFGRWTFDVAELRKLGVPPAAPLVSAARRGRIARHQDAGIQQQYEAILGTRHRKGEPK